MEARIAKLLNNMKPCYSGVLSERAMKSGEKALTGIPK
jgi:hypothetical protein